VLSFSSLFPNPRQPLHGVFVENRLRHLAATGEVELRVMAPVPWFPSTAAQFGRWATFAGIPDREERHSIPVWHPRHVVLPKVGMSMAPALMYLGVRRLARQLIDEADIDLIDAHYFYPDGVAAALLGRELGKPVVITARGTDLNLIPRHPLAKAQIRWAARRAAACVTVCEALARPLAEMGVPPDRLRVLRNGVDLAQFRPRARAQARQRLGLDGPVLLSVGLLIERKGHHLVIDALADLPGFTLLIAGGGPERGALEQRVRDRGLGDRVRFLGEVAHEQLAAIYTAADALVLASSREGWANVLLESIACGTPVVATDVWGTAEVVTCPQAGRLVRQRSAAGIADEVRRLFAAPPDRAATRRYAEGHDWEATTRGQLDLFATIAPARP
jgi:glycosyltransferase involved in cell wall biosynthesis